MRKRLTSIIGAIVIMLGLPAPAMAIVINDTAGSATSIALGGGHPAVVHLIVGGFRCSGALIDATHVVTAEHCTSGILTGAMTVQFHHLNNDGASDLNIAVSAKAEMNATNQSLDGTDIAILTLASAAPGGVGPLAFASGVTIGDTVDTVGFGLNGEGNVGHGGSWDGKRWAAENTLDQFGTAACTTEGFCTGGSVAGSANILNTDFDDGSAANNLLGNATMLTNEGTTAGGDSGGPLLINGLIAGVLTGGTTGNSVFGDISWWTGTFMAAARAFITANSNAVFVDPAQIPEPGTLMLMLLGLAGLFAGRQRRLSTV